jgi:NTE family protein
VIHPESYADRISTSELAPVRRIPGDPPGDAPEPGIGLCLSGGGYRAMLFHLGTLWRLNELGFLKRLARISSVSGGSITAGVLGAAWSELGFDAGGHSRTFEELVVNPVRRLAERTIDLPAVLAGLVMPGGVARRVAGHYDRALFHGKTLQALPPPPAPLFVINATNVKSGVLWRFTRPYMWDYRVGKIAKPALKLALAVAASSAFPPVLSPLKLRFSASDYEPESGDSLQEPPYTTHVELSDGGVYDNLGLETVWKRYETVLVSDAGGRLTTPKRTSTLWPLHAVRTMMLIDSQVRALRKRQVIASYRGGRSDGQPLRRGAYWGIRSEVADFGLADSLQAPDDVVALADEPTRLRALPDRTQKRLINWGYVICDTAMRRHVAPTAVRPTRLPYPEEP